MVHGEPPTTSAPSQTCASAAKKEPTEGRLLKCLMANYDPAVRPAINHVDTVNVTVQVLLLKIIGLVGIGICSVLLYCFYIMLNMYEEGADPGKGGGWESGLTYMPYMVFFFLLLLLLLLFCFFCFFFLGGGSIFVTVIFARDSI